MSFRVNNRFHLKLRDQEAIMANPDYYDLWLMGIITTEEALSQDHFTAEAIKGKAIRAFETEVSLWEQNHWSWTPMKLNELQRICQSLSDESRTRPKYYRFS